MNIPKHILDKATSRDYQQGETIDIYNWSDYIAILEDGYLKVRFTSFESKGLMEILDPGSIFSEDGFLFLGREIESIIALKDSSLTLINRSLIENELTVNPEFGYSLLRKLTQKALLYSERLLNFSKYDAKKRTRVGLDRLFRLHGKYQDNYLFLDLPLTQEDMADLFGVSRVTVTQTIGELKAENKLKYNNGFYLKE